MSLARLAVLCVAALVVSLSGCIGAWFGRETQPTLFLSSASILGGEWEILLSVADMPQGGLAAIHVQHGGLLFDAGEVSSLNVQGLNGFITVASHVDEGEGKASFMLVSVAGGVKSGSIAKLTFVPRSEAQATTFMLIRSHVDLVSDQLALIDQWVAGPP